MDISDTMLRLGVTFGILAPRLFFFYLDNFVTKRQGQDVFALMGPLLLVGIICLSLFFYKSVQLYKGIRDKTYSVTDILETGLLLFMAGVFAALPLGMIFAVVPEGLKNPITSYLMELFGQITGFSIDKNGLLVIILIAYYALWLYRIFTARRTRSIQSAHE